MEEERSNSGLEINFAVILHNFTNAAKRLGWIGLILALAVGAFRYYSVDRSSSPVYSSSAVFSVQARHASTMGASSFSSRLIPGCSWSWSWAELSLQTPLPPQPQPMPACSP